MNVNDPIEMKDMFYNSISEKKTMTLIRKFKVDT